MLEQTFNTPLPLDLDVSIPSGDIDIETADGEESLVTVDGDERLLADVEIRQDGNRVVVSYRGKGKFGFSFGRNDLHVRASIPHGAGAKVKTASADIDVVGRLGTLDIDAVSGDVRVRGEVTGNAVIKTVSGDAEVETVGGKLSAGSVSGDLRIGPTGGAVDTKTVSGDIRCEAVTQGDVRFNSVSGDIEIGIAAGSLVDVDAGSTSGDLSSEVPLGSLPEPGAENGGPMVVVRGRTISGDVRIFRA
ncbi:MAG TPA: DUF4097 family beta strand repeat-containing protein [Gaiellaceae bacterium]